MRKRHKEDNKYKKRIVKCWSEMSAPSLFSTLD